MGVFWGSWSRRDPEGSNQNFRELLQMVENGQLKPITTEVYDFNDYAEAFRCLTYRRAKGKVILSI
jgi:NADPH2:quinone reductase